MKRAALTTLCLAGAVTLLSACGERAQTNGGQTGAKRDASPVAGTDAAVFRQGGWKAGDQAAWSQHLKARAQYGMNDHSRTTN